MLSGMRAAKATKSVPPPQRAPRKGKQVPNGMRADDRACIVPITSIKPWVNNPRKNDNAVPAVAGSIQEFDFNDPIIVCRATGEIVAGHTRHKAALKLGLQEVPIRYTDLTPEKAYAYAIAANRTGEIATWDEIPLSKLLAEFKADDAPWLNSLGFDIAQLSRLIRVAAHTRRLDAAADEVPDPPREPISKLGDVWELGPHRLLCGSCVDLKRIVDERSCKLLVTDPPYGINYAEKNRRLNLYDPKKRNEAPIASDNETSDALQAYLVEWFSAVRGLLDDGACYYVTAPSGGGLLHFMQALQEADFLLRHVLVWVKNQSVFGRSDYHYRHENILYGWVEGTHHALTDRTQDSVWEIPKSVESKLHPTMKPVELYARAYRNSSDFADRGRSRSTSMMSL